MRILLSVLLALSFTYAAADEHFPRAGTGELLKLLRSEDLSGGDRIILESGAYGPVVVRKRSFDPPLIIEPAPDATPVATLILLDKSSGVHISGIVVRPLTAQSLSEPVNEKISELNARVTKKRRGTGKLVQINSGKSIVLDALDIATIEDTDAWAKEDWRSKAQHGMTIKGRDITVTNSEIRNVRHGIEADVTGAHIEGNTISYFSGDGIRGLGDNSVYRGNTVHTCVKVDSNHDDGFQSWSRGGEKKRPGRGVIRNVRIENNRFENGDHPSKCLMQGIGLFDGIYEDWVIDKNVVIADAWHGITVMGARNVQITRNIVVDAKRGRPGPPWISIAAHKDGRPPENSVVHDNVTQRSLSDLGKKWRSPNAGVLSYRNLVVKNPARALTANP